MKLMLAARKSSASLRQSSGVRLRPRRGWTSCRLMPRTLTGRPLTKRPVPTISISLRPTRRTTLSSFRPPARRSSARVWRRGCSASQRAAFSTVPSKTSRAVPPGSMRWTGSVCRWTVRPSGSLRARSSVTSSPAAPAALARTASIRKAAVRPSSPTSVTTSTPATWSAGTASRLTFRVNPPNWYEAYWVPLARMSAVDSFWTAAAIVLAAPGRQSAVTSNSKAVKPPSCVPCELPVDPERGQALGPVRAEDDPGALPVGREGHGLEISGRGPGVTDRPCMVQSPGTSIGAKPLAFRSVSFSKPRGGAAWNDQAPSSDRTGDAIPATSAGRGDVADGGRVGGLGRQRPDGERSDDREREREKLQAVHAVLPRGHAPVLQPRKSQAMPTRFKA